MRRKKWILAAAICIAAVAFSCNAYAASSDIVKTIKVSVKEKDVETGKPYSVTVSSGSHTEITDISYSTEEWSWTPGKKVTISLTVVPTDGYRFKKGTSTVSVSGADLANSSITSTSATIRANYTPGVTLKAPENLYFEETKLHWDKVEYAPQYEVKLKGAYSKTLKTTSNYIDLSDYMTDSENELNVSVRAVPKTDAQKKYLSSSDWTKFDDGITPSDDNTESGTWKDTSKGLKFINNDGDYVTGWQYLGKGWYYFAPKTCVAVSGWLFWNNDWYWLDPNTNLMLTGWQKLPWGSGKEDWFYFNASGAMQKGWISTSPAGPWYYLDMTDGHMLHDTVTPDGYVVGSDGAMIS